MTVRSDDPAARSDRAGAMPVPQAPKANLRLVASLPSLLRLHPS